MDTSRIGSDLLDLLSKLTGQPLRHQDLSAPIVFLAPLVSVLTGVMFADKNVSDEEKQRWQKTIKHFIPSEQSAVQLTQRLSKGIREHKIYANLNELLKLAQPLSGSERLLLLGFGYEMSAADGQMDDLEKRYLQSIAKHLNVSFSHLSVLEASFTGQSVDQSVLEEVRLLLDPARFHDLDVMFVNAANNLLLTLPAPLKQAATRSHSTVAYKQLEAFQQQRIQLDKLCFQINQVVQACIDKSYLTDEPLRMVDKVSQKLQSQRFRVAVVGEFSQGKSTLLNALLGEEIQPTRAIPCSGAVTMLRYGDRKRVICRYRDGQEVEIPVDQYKEKAAIPREVAQEQRLENLAESDLDEIIFEHPDLALCKSGVEIVDSPGLNEHPERTAITQKLLQDTDAVIFLTNAARLLPEKEKELIQQEVRLVLNKLKGTPEKRPVDNLFIVVNFFDLLEEAEDRQDVVHRLESFIKRENLLPAVDGRVHYISAKAALKASLQEQENEYLHSFQKFTQSLEQFLTYERGTLKLTQAGREINHALEASFNGLTQAELSLDGKVNLSEAEKQSILDQIGEASGRDVKIRCFTNEIVEELAEQTINSWNMWIENLPEKMMTKSAKWKSEHSPRWSQKQLIRDYTNQFTQELSREIDKWSSSQFANVILKPRLELLDAEIHKELEAIQSQFEQVDLEINTGLSKQLNLAIARINDDFGGQGFWGGLGTGGAVAAALIVFTPVGLIAAGLTALAASFGLGMMNANGLKEEVTTSGKAGGLKKEPLKAVVSLPFVG